MNIETEEFEDAFKEWFYLTYEHMSSGKIFDWDVFYNTQHLILSSVLVDELNKIDNTLVYEYTV